MDYRKIKNKVGSNGGQMMMPGACAQLSCDDPQVGLGQCLMAGDLTTFSSLLAEVAPLEDGGQENQEDFPLPEEHWLNQPVAAGDSPQLLLQMSVQQPAVDFTQLLVRGGARADMYSDDFGQAIIHSCILGDYAGIHLPALLADPRNRACVNVSMQPGGQTALHLAAERGNAACLKVLLDQMDIEVDAKDNSGGRTALFVAAAGRREDCVQLLLQHGADPDIKCGRRTPREVIEENLPYFNIGSVKVRAKPRRGSVEYLMELIEAKDFLLFKSVVHFVSLREMSEKGVRGYTLLQKCALTNQPAFAGLLLRLGVNPNLATPENPIRPHLLAAYKAHHQVLKMFFGEGSEAGKPQKGVTTNFAVWTRDTKETILHMVLKKSQKRALQGVSSDLELQTLDEEYEKCLKLLLESSPAVQSQLSRVINKRDNLEFTALHYAAQMWSQEVVTGLLQLGANIGVRNSFGETALSRILPETLEQFLDSCTNHSNHPLHKDFKVEFNYSWLAPPVDDYQSEEWDSERQAELEKEGLPETESLWCMAQSPAHRHLLRHPAVTSFLWLKWQRIRRFFSRNIRMYLIFVTSLTWYIFTRFGGVLMNKQRSEDSGGRIDLGGLKHEEPTAFCQQPSIYSGSHGGFWYIVFLVESFFLIVTAIRDLSRGCSCSSSTEAIIAFFSSWFELLLLGLLTILIVFSSGGLWYVLCILSGMLLIREMFQMAASLKRYFFSLENLLELVMLGLLGVLLFAPVPPPEDPDAVEGSGIQDPEETQTVTQDCQLLRHLAAICILLSWTELTILIAKHPRLSRYNVYISMFYKVLQTFLLFLIWYSFFVVAFALGFYIMLHKDIPGFVPGEDHYKYFDSPWTSLVKTSTMFVGELEFSDIPIDTDSALAWLSFAFLLVFVFLIVVILMNLLNGLAVSDTGIIMEKAEIVSYIARVETISYMESVLLGDPFGFLAKWPAVLSRLPNLALCNRVYSVCPGARRIGHALTGATGTLLFYSLLPDKKAQFPGEHSSGCGGCRGSGVEDIPEDIMQAARSLALKKEEETRKFDIEEYSKKVVELLLDQQRRIQSLEAKLQTLLRK